MKGIKYVSQNPPTCHFNSCLVVFTIFMKKYTNQINQIGNMIKYEINRGDSPLPKGAIPSEKLPRYANAASPSMNIAE